MAYLTSLPNLLTFGRILLIPIFVAVFYLPFKWAKIASAVIFAIASITDWLDGYFARKMDKTSVFGAFLDPVADKLLVATSLLLLVSSNDINYITVPAIIIVGREIVVSALREWMAEIGDRASIAVSYIGKIKTIVQMVSLILLLANRPIDNYWGMAGFIMLYLAAVLTLWSMIIYIKIAWPLLMRKKHESAG